ncbi:hypothetical protein HDU98_000499 [Podochytrium sp. JEL0797]|nr:hypothetical protein HDU98_000499 [Podochytrium sp. JEL0797]
MTVASAPKRLRGDAHPDLVFRQGLLGNESVDLLRSQYTESHPYLHITIPHLVSSPLLRKVRTELLAIHATRKETDIYRVFQTGDLANLDGLPSHELRQLESLLELRNALYSNEFREFVSKVCGVGKLSASKADLSHNIYKQGCHLLTHDDVIGTRSVSYIIYLTDPDDPWREEDGGGLELYPVVEKGTPAVHPSVVIPPVWNQMAMFAVQPGHSFHSVAEVVAVDRTRPSISGWFHVQQPEDMTPQELAAAQEAKKNAPDLPLASMDQLLNDDDNLPFRPLPEFPTPTDDEQDIPLTRDEIAFLKPFVNPLYLKPNIISQANERFCDESSIQLTSFLEPSLAAAISAATAHQDEQSGFLLKTPRPDTVPALPANYQAGVHKHWTPTGPSHKHRFMQLNALPATSPIKSHTDPSIDLSAIQQTLFESKPFLRLIHLITSLQPTTLRSRVRRFRPGMDYTLATTSNASSDLNVLDATLCFVCERTPADKAAWESDEVGGFDCYMAADEGNDDPAQYRAQKTKSAQEEQDGGDGGALLSVSATSNCLSLVMREGDVMRFIKYVGARAAGSRWDVAAEFEYE